MKATDIALVIVVGIVSVLGSYWIGNLILGDPSNKTTEVYYMDKISDSIESPDVETFNVKAKNPTVEVYVGNCQVGQVWDTGKLKCVSKDGSDDTTTDDTKTDTTDNTKTNTTDNTDSTNNTQNNSGTSTNQNKTGEWLNASE